MHNLHAPWNRQVSQEKGLYCPVSSMLSDTVNATNVPLYKMGKQYSANCHLAVSLFI
jgi:hypothetical protein